MKYTPCKIAEENLFYTIPIYQRLFEWDTENIVTLLEDLMKEYKTTKGQDDYYIGMLTSTKDNELVDGQQRFTVIMLLGCVLQKDNNYTEWKDFLMVGNRLRLEFTSRPLDNAYLRSLIENKGENIQSFKNLKMQNGLKQIKDFMDKIPEGTRSSFSKYIFEHLCFFISNLPEGYSPKDLNKYFERMNTSGKNLEQHEILKVKLLKNLDEDIDKYMLLWNKLADVDTPLIRERKNENIEEVKRQALRSNIATVLSFIGGLEGNSYDKPTSIGEIEMSNMPPQKEHERNKDSRCALSFTYLLLQVLYRFCRKSEKRIECAINEFFKPGNLLNIFEKYLPFSGKDVNKENIKVFMEMLVKARLALDICFVRPTDYGYSLDMNLSEDDSALKNLLMFQSMLYVSSSNYTNYRWFNWLMDEVDKNGIPDAESFYISLKSKIDEEFPLPSYEELTYKGDNRYWFWRLDFYIWQHRKELFKDDPAKMAIAENYVFKRNRSIEHVAPQNPQSDSMMKWGDTKKDEVLRDSFGNLVMISQGLNSALSNESFEVKRAHVESYCNGSKYGSIESLKLLMIYYKDSTKWDRDAIEQHGKTMYGYLQEALKDQGSTTINSATGNP